MDKSVKALNKVVTRNFLNNPNTFLRSYLRDENGNISGVVVGLKVKDQFRVGWAMVNPNKELNGSNKNRAVEVAVGRAVKGVAPDRRRVHPKNARLINNHLSDMIERMERYYRVEGISIF